MDKKNAITNICLFMIIVFCILSCIREKDAMGISKAFHFPDRYNSNQTVYNQIKQTCAERWDLSQMIDNTFEIIQDNDEYLLHCDGYSEGKLYHFVIRVDKYGIWINDGKSLKE